MYPRLRIYETVKPIIDEAALIMGVNPYPRRDHGRLVAGTLQFPTERPSSC
ncbi:MAG TPA: hypothetical protein VEC02_06755 [Nitrososphaerales archaeon]|nr:hypothetical protein [Nitrososphaerales archaeon]